MKHLNSERRIVGPLIVVVLSIFNACKQSSASSLSHDFGAIESATPPVFSCKQKAADTDDEMFQSYGQNLMEQIINSNQSVLNGITSESLCLKIEPNYEINASASFRGEIYLNRGILWISNNDAQVAAVLAHELAHAISQHSIAPNNNQSLMKNQTYRTACDRIATLLREMMDPIDANYSRERGYFFQIIFENVDSERELLEIESARDLYILTMEAFTASVVTQSPSSAQTIKPDPYQILTATPFDPSNLGASRNFKLEEAVYKNHEDLLRMAQDARNQLLARLPKANLEQFPVAEKRLVAAMAQALKLNHELEEQFNIKKDFEEKSLGKDVAANWEEQDADEKGLELFVRAGYQPEQFALMLDNLGILDIHEVPASYTRIVKQGEESKAANSLADHLSDHLGANCTRGSAIHPQACWRAADARAEMDRHKQEYAKIQATDPKENMFPGRLEALHKHYFNGLFRDYLKLPRSQAEPIKRMDTNY